MQRCAADLYRLNISSPETVSELYCYKALRIEVTIPSLTAHSTS